MIGKTINNLLTSSASLVKLVGVNIYPYVMKENTPLPAVVYAIESVEPEYHKGGWAGDMIEFSVYSVSGDYSTLQSVVSEVRAALELKESGYGTETINRIEMVSQDEEFDGGTFLFTNKLTFRVKANKY